MLDINNRGLFYLTIPELLEEVLMNLKWNRKADLRAKIRTGVPQSMKQSGNQHNATAGIIGITRSTIKEI
jgi:hypothetical protein